ncbi:hypothetical protein HMPREF9543_03547 [Escherichia coli MS 146-1]|nr:hypothetical protein HMPREF9543_03547 [Escherichia coli MS 146-1]
MRSALVMLSQTTQPELLRHESSVNRHHDFLFSALLQIVGGDKLIIPFC